MKDGPQTEMITADNHLSISAICSGFVLDSGSRKSYTDCMYRIPVYRVALVREGSQAVPTKQIGSPRDAHDILRQFIGASADREHLVVLTLDTKNKAIGINTVSIGDLNSAIATPREVFKLAVLQNACSIIVAHNHPSGSVEPSEEDLAISRRLDNAGKVMGIDVLDHMVIGEHGTFASLRERGFFPCPLPPSTTSQGQFLLNSPRPVPRLRRPSPHP